MKGPTSITALLLALVPCGAFVPAFTARAGGIQGELAQTTKLRANSQTTFRTIGRYSETSVAPVGIQVVFQGLLTFNGSPVEQLVSAYELCKLRLLAVLVQSTARSRKLRPPVYS